MVQDPQFGPVIACGAGGTAVELLNDVSVRLTPLGDSVAEEMIKDPTTIHLLDCCRGRPKADVASLRSVVLRLGVLAEDLPEVAEVDLNPLIVCQDGTEVVDARIRVEQRAPSLRERARPRPHRSLDHA